jgi:glycosyltransferase involved in cell wall biosynthesis
MDFVNWVLVSGDFTHTGGMDRANYELAWHIADRLREPVALVAHRVDEPLATHPLVRFERVSRPWGKHLLGAPLLSQAGWRAAQRACRANPATRVVVNGANCRWMDVNWVHMVNSAYVLADRQAPVTFRIKNRLTHLLDRRAERKSLPRAAVVLTNSQRTKADLIQYVGVAAERIRVVYYGTDPAVFRPPSADERRSARNRWQVRDEEVVLGFIGALGYDARKGMDTLLEAARLLGAGARPWVLLAAGGGRLDYWRHRAAVAGVADRVRFLGHTKEVPDLLAATDVLVSPTRNEAYGLGIHEALCRGVPVIVSASAGVAERYPAGMRELVLPNPEDAADLAARIRAVGANLSGWVEQATALGEQLRCRSWANMAEEIIFVIRNS